MLTKEQFAVNVSRWAEMCPQEANTLLSQECSHLAFCTTEQGEVNLRKETPEGPVFYHAQQGALQEAQQWFKSLDLYNVKVLFVYGVGLGYYYDAAKEWLHEDKTRVLVFLEDDLEVIHRLFETEKGQEIMGDWQVWLQHFHTKYTPENEKVAEISEKGLDFLPIRLFTKDFNFSALKVYETRERDFLRRLWAELDLIKNIKACQAVEYMKYGDGFFTNFYKNLFELPDACIASELYGKFEGVPAIICGAGPSLEKNLQLLEGLRDRALIFAGGTAINTVGVNGFLPHFGVTIDPNIAQYSRLFMNQAFEVPFFYRNRVYPEALKLIHGDHIYVPGSGGYDIAKWFEEKLGIKGEQISEGHNVVNFSLSIAKALGCNPIIFVGLDLAYSQGKGYSPGVARHPILDINQELMTRTAKENVVVKEDVEGQPVMTLWKWLVESTWIAHFAVTSPSLKVINATEGGIGFEGIPNMSLKEVSETLLTRQFDFEALVHRELQESRSPENLNHERLVGIMKDMQHSLENCVEQCGILRKEFHLVHKAIADEGKAPSNIVSDKALASIKALNEEPAYKAIISRFNEAFLAFFGRAHLLREAPDYQFAEELDIVQEDSRRAFVQKRRYEFLKTASRTNLSFLKKAVELDEIRTVLANAVNHQFSEGKIRAREYQYRRNQGEYLIANGRMKISDPELNLEIEDAVCEIPVTRHQANDASVLFPELQGKLHGKLELADQSGQLKAECHYRHGLLHGPSSFYDSRGNLIAKSWYVDGKKQGKAYLYYPSGEIYAIQRFLDDLRHGRQEFYYGNGNMKASLDYHHGRLHGVVELFYPEGEKMRQIYFKEGRREGKENFWNLLQILEQQVQYENDRPVGTSRMWHRNGRLAREMVYDEQSSLVSVKGWNHDGMPLPREAFMKDSFIQRIATETNVLTGSLEGLYDEVSALVPSLPEGENTTQKESMDQLRGEIEALQDEMNNLRSIQKEMQERSSVKSDTTEDKLWDTPETRRMIGRQLEEASAQLGKEVMAIEEVLKMAADILKNQKDKIPPDANDQ